MPFIATSVEVNEFPSVARKKISELELDYRQYPYIGNDGAGRPADVPADVVDDRDDVFVQEAL